MLSAEELLAGANIDFEVVIPADILNPVQGESTRKPGSVRLKPLTVHDLQLISRAARENDSLTAVLMVQRAITEPTMTMAEVNGMHAGLLQYLLQQVKNISGISASVQQMDQAMAAPLMQATFILAREFGWTPQEVNDLTLGQVLLNLEMLEQGYGSKN